MYERNKTRFFQAKGVRMKYGSIFDYRGDLLNLKERGLDGCCEGTNSKHQWLLIPKWSDCVKEGGKEYIICLNCLEMSHL
jgi:hypothetical protein